jgi:hypothetical protein
MFGAAFVPLTQFGFDGIRVFEAARRSAPD